MRIAPELAAAGLALLAIAGAAAPSAAMPVIGYCHGYGCTIRTPLRFSAGDLARLKTLLAAGRKDAAAERAAIASAVMWYETKAGREVGTADDLPKAAFGSLGRPGQLDCVDESTNTTSLLQLMAAQGLLKFHTVGRTKGRGYLLDGRYPHNTATITETATGIRWAIDSWPRANGERPDVMPLEQWSKEGGLSG